MCSLFSERKAKKEAQANESNEPESLDQSELPGESPKSASSGNSTEDKTETAKPDEYQKLAAEAADWKDKYMRLLAEFENARKRAEREKAEFVKYANEALLSDFLNTLDNLERSVDAAKANHEDYSAFLKGIEMVMAQLYEMLKKNQVRPIEAKGKKFDPHVHEALMQQETNEHPEHTVVEEFQKGYLFGDRVLRTAKVKVAQKKSTEPKKD